MTTHSGEPVNDGFWRRPPPAAPGDAPEPGTAPADPASGAAGIPAPPDYPGPPPSAPPPPGWRPPVYLQPAPPRQLPAQDLPALEAAEGNARTLTYGIGMLAGAIVLVLICLLCSRILF